MKLEKHGTPWPQRNDARRINYKIYLYSERIKRALISKTMSPSEICFEREIWKNCVVLPWKKKAKKFLLVERTIEETTSQISSITNDIKSLMCSQPKNLKCYRATKQ